MTVKTTTTVLPKKAGVVIPDTVHSAGILCPEMGELEVIAEVTGGFYGCSGLCFLEPN
jgi:hypothetical protein